MNFKPHDFCISCARKLLREQSTVCASLTCILVCVFRMCICSCFAIPSIQFRSIHILFCALMKLSGEFLAFSIPLWTVCQNECQEKRKEMRDNNNFGHLVRCHVDVDNRGNIYWLTPFKWINWIFVKLWKKFAQVFHVLCTHQFMALSIYFKFNWMKSGGK